jgi:hypothetical protein
MVADAISVFENTLGLVLPQLRRMERMESDMMQTTPRLFRRMVKETDRLQVLLQSWGKTIVRNLNEPYRDT